MIITIDGPSASGKSTVARLVARQLDCFYLYTGLLYRGLGYVLHTQYGYDVATIAHAQQADIDAIIMQDSFMYTYSPIANDQIIYNRTDITPSLSTATVDSLASHISTNEYAHTILSDLQRRIITQQECAIIDSRDGGSHVFPEASIKLYMTATPHIRAQRWLEKQKRSNHNFTLADAEKLIAERDNRDMNRMCSPLCIAPQAHVIDTSDKSIAHVVELVLEYIKKEEELECSSSL